MKVLFRWIKNRFDRTKYWFVILSNYLKYGAYIRKELRVSPQPRLSKGQRKEIRRYFASFGFKIRRFHWHRMYGGFQNRYSKKYIPQDLFFSHLEMALNRYEYVKLQDKNLLDKVFKNVKQPKTIVKKINGFYQKNGFIIPIEDAIQTILVHEEALIKPTTDTSGGRGIRKMDLSFANSQNYRKELVMSTLEKFKKDFIVQEMVEQSGSMKLLNSTSLNTIRICTYLRPVEVVVLFAVVRYGNEGVFLDNISQGGYYSVINDNGSLQRYGYSQWKDKITETHEGTALKDFIIPNYKQIKEITKNLHQQVPHFRLISWDIALDRDETPMLIECNSFGQSIDFQSVTGPLFREYTDEVLAIAQKSRNSVLN